MYTQSANIRMRLQANGHLACGYLNAHRIDPAIMAQPALTDCE